MVRSVIGLVLGFGLSLVLSTTLLAVFWGQPAPRGSSVVAVIIASLCVAFGGLVAGVVGERRSLLLGGLVGLATGAFVSLWSGVFPLKRLFFESDALRVYAVAITTIAGLLGGWLAGRLIAPGGLLTEDR